MDEETTFAQWFEIASKYAESLNYAVSDNPEDYRGYYEDGYTPEEAIREDLSYCQ